MSYKKESPVQTINEPNKLVFIENDKPMTTSRLIAKTFGKKHKDVLRDLKNLGTSDEFWRRNFAPSNYIDRRGKEQPEYHITKNGFAILAFGYTGEKAMQFKESYIERFDEMENALKTGAQFLKETNVPLSGLIYLFYAGHKWFVYREVLKHLGFSTKSGAVGSRKKRMSNMFFKLFGRVMISEKYAMHLSQFKKLIEEENNLMQMQIPFNQTEGGSYE